MHVGSMATPNKFFCFGTVSLGGSGLISEVGFYDSCRLALSTLIVSRVERATWHLT